MPPKRKRNDTEGQLTSSTGKPRGSSTRSGPSEAATERGSKTKPSTTDQPKSRASRGSAANLTSKKKAKGSNAQTEVSESVSDSEKEPPPPRKKGKKSSELPTSSRKKVSSTVLSSSYSRRSMEKLFATYADEQDKSIIGAEGLERLCTEANIPMEGLQPLILAWLLEASEFGKLTVKEWVKGLDALRIDNLEKLGCALFEYECLLVSEMAAPKLQSDDKKTANESYNRDLHYWMYAADVHKSFLKFYTFVFLLAKAPQERNIDIEMAKTFWEVLLSKKYPIVKDLIEFINEKGTLKGVNKDLWGMTLDFCKTFNTSLEGFETDGAWPTVLDEFYVWKKARESPDVLEGVDQADI